MIVTRVANHIEREEATGIAIGSNQAWAERGKGPRREQRHRRGSPIAIAVNTAPLTIERFSPQRDMAARAQDFLQGEARMSDVRISVGSVALLPPEMRDAQMRRWQMARLRRPDQPLPSHAVLFSAKLPDGRWVNATGLIRPTDTSSIFGLLVQTLLLYAAVMIPLALVARRIAKPLGGLTERVQRVGLAGEVEPLAAEGPKDVRQLIDAFNAMQARVSTLLGEKDVMLGAIGHDLKTPLASLRVRIESVDDDEDREKMAASIDEMVTILDDILMLARLGKSGEALQLVDIGALVESITGEFEGASFPAPEQRIVGQVRPVLLRRALRNLIGNAVTYGKQANITLTERSGQIIVEIADDGPGIDPSLMDSMFEPFTRAESSRSRATGGSGLGLTIARAIARSHGGDVILENRREGGLKAFMTLKN